MPNYSVSGLTSFIGREGHGFNVTLCIGTRKVAHVDNAADGGVFRFHFLAQPAQAVCDERDLEAHVAKLPRWFPADPIPSDEELGYAVDRDMYVSQLVADLELDRAIRAHLKRKMANGLVFILDGQVKLAKVKSSPAMLSALLQKYPGAVALNDLPIAKAVELFRANGGAQ